MLFFFSHASYIPCCILGLQHWSNFGFFSEVNDFCTPRTGTSCVSFHGSPLVVAIGYISFLTVIMSHSLQPWFMLLLLCTCIYVTIIKANQAKMESSFFSTSESEFHLIMVSVHTKAIGKVPKTC